MLLAVKCLAGLVLACPSCMPLSKSLGEEFEFASGIVLAQPLEAGSARYRVLRVLRGKLKPGRVIVAAASQERGPVFLSTNQSEGSPLWSGQPQPAGSERVVQFGQAVAKLPARPRGKTSLPQRMEFFSQHLNSTDPVIADSAYAELSAAPYRELQPYSRRLGQARLRNWLDNPNTPEEYCSLYYTMLSQAAAKSDQKWLEARVLSAAGSSPRGSLPALLFAYLQVVGESGLPLIQKRYLQGDLPQRMTALQALRFVGQENTRLRKALLPLFHTQLSDPRTAPGLIRDLALWQDWSCAEQLWRLMESKDSYSYLKMSALRYLVACPRPDIRKRLQALKRQPPDWLRGAWPPPFRNDDFREER